MSAATVGALAVGHVSLPTLSTVETIGGVNGFALYTVTDGFPGFSPSRYRLKVDGLVNRPLSMTLDEILHSPTVAEHDDYHCVTGWTVPHVRWTGLRLASLLDRVQPHPEAGALTFYSFDGIYTESLTMSQARQRNVLLAHSLNSKPLLRAQGAPLRLVVPGMYGYKYIKWVHRIELVRQPIEGYWELNGYDRDAYIGKSNLSL